MKTDKSTRYIQRKRGKSKVIGVDKETRRIVRLFKQDLNDCIEINDLPPEQARAIRYITTKLESYDRNILLLYYSSGCDSNYVGKTLGVAAVVIRNRVNTIIKDIKKHLHII